MSRCDISCRCVKWAQRVTVHVASTLRACIACYRRASLLLQGHHDDLADWGHEYVRSLAGEIGAVWQERVAEAAAATANAPPVLDDLRAMVGQIVPFDMAHNAEVEVRIWEHMLARTRQ